MLIFLVISDHGRNIICGIYEKYQKRLIYTATQILGKERGEEAVHDVFVALLEKFENNFEILGDKPGQYFVIMVRNHSLNIQKRERVDIVPLEEELVDDDIFQSSAAGPEETLTHREALARLVALVRRLTPAMRQVFEYKYIEGYSNIEIADMLELSQSAVSTRLDKARKRLKEMLESEVNE